MVSTRPDRIGGAEPGRLNSRQHLDARGRRHPLDLHRLQQFVTIVDVGSLTDAAAELGVSQQALSAAIRTLEKQLSVTLFVRTRGMQPSAAGIRLYESAKSLLAGASRTVKEVQDAAWGRPAVLTVGYTPAMKSIHAYDVIGQHGPRNVSLKLVCLDATAIRERLVAGDIDIGLCHGAIIPEGLTGKMIGALPINVAVRSADTIGPGDDRVSLSALSGLRLLQSKVEDGSVEQTSALSRCRDLGFDPEVAESSCAGLDAVAMPLTADRGFAFVSDEPGLYLRDRVTVLALEEDIQLPVQAVWLRDAANGLIGEVIAALPSTTTVTAR